MEDNLPLEPVSEPLASSPEPAPVPAAKTSIFFGRFGMRAGWGFAIFVVACFIFISLGSLVALAASGHLKEVITAQQRAKGHPHEPRPALHIPFEPSLVIGSDATSFLGMLALCWVFARAERRKLGFYGIGRNRLRDFLPGAFWGLAALSLLVLTLHTFHLLYFDSRLLFGPAIFLYGIKWLIAFLFVGFSEEYMLRGYLQFTLTRGVFGIGEDTSPERARFIAFWIAAVIMSLVFGAMHLGNGGENALGIFQVVLVGLVFSYALWRTGSLWWAIGFHMAWDWAQSFLYGVPDSGNISVGRLFQTHVAGKQLLSGGVDGPEGSILCVFIMLLVLVVIRFTTTPGPQPPLEQLPAPAPEPTALIA
jgi:membrane protease YdiL (CAAX protease family)